MWHASIALLGSDGPVLVQQLDRKLRRLGFALALRLLEGVGSGPTLEGSKLVALHVRRSLSLPEIARLDPAWLAIPAIDLG